MRINAKLEAALQLLCDELPGNFRTRDQVCFNRLFDVGCDHARLCIEAVNRGIAEEAWAIDLREGPLKLATANILEQELENRIHLLLSNGLDDVTVESGDAVTILGMGGLEIGEILSRADIPAGVPVVLQAMRSLPELRNRLSQLQFSIERERLALYRNKLYTLFSVKPCLYPVNVSEVAAFIGEYWMDHWREDALWPLYRDKLIATIDYKLNGQAARAMLLEARQRLASMPEAPAAGGS